MANAEIIAVGSELLTPQKIDTNSLYLTDQLNSLGVEVVAKSVIGDDRTRLTETIRAAVARSQIVILTGGLGPTEDDVTRDAVASALGRKQIFDQGVCDWLVERFQKFGRSMAENNKRQAYILEGAEMLQNDWGTAPGQWIDHHGTVVLLLPGPPRELKGMFPVRCLPRFEKLLPPQVIRTRFYRVAGMGESDLDSLIAPVYTKYENPVTTILAAPGDIQIHFRARCQTAEEAERLLAELGSQIEPLLGARIYSHVGEPLEKVVGQLLISKGAHLAVAESATAGMLGERITAVKGSSDYFLGGFLTYTNGMKTTLLGIPDLMLREHTAVSEPVAVAMAEAAQRLTGANYALSITGYAEPGNGESSIVFIGLASPAGCEARRLQFVGDRERVRSLAVTTALDLLRKSLLSER